MSIMTLTSLESSWRADPGLTEQGLTFVLGEAIKALHAEAEEQGLVVDWATFTCNPEVDVARVETIQGGARTYRSTTVHAGVVAAKVEEA